MPGFMGCVATNAAASREPTARLRAYAAEKLPSHPWYKERGALVADTAEVHLLVPKIDADLGGVYRAAEGGGVVFMGRFEEAPFERVGSSSDDIAHALWQMYRERGRGFARDLAGSFLLFVDDPGERRSLLINDHYASYQCFFAKLGEALCFAPEVNILVDACGIQGTIDVGSVVSMFVNGECLNSKTYLREVNALKPGSLVEISAEGGIRFDTYYRFAFDEPLDKRPEQAYVNGLGEKLLGAMQSRADILGETIIPLSGGWDSRALVACAGEVAKRSGTRLRTVTWGVPGGEEVADTDPLVARQVAEYLGTDHTYIPRPTASWIREFEYTFEMIDGLTDDCVFHPNEHALFRNLHTEHGATHVFSGNQMFGPAGVAETDTEARARIGIHALRDYEPLWELFRTERVEDIKDLSDDYVNQVLAECPNEDYNNRKDWMHYAQRIQNYTNHSAHYKQCAVWVHNPWLDRSILDFMRSVPPAMREVKQLFKSTVNQRFPELQKIPMAGVRFDNIEDWGAVMREQGDMRDYVTRHLLSEQNGLHELIDPERLRAYVDGFLSGESVDQSPMVVFIDAIKNLVRHVPPIYRVLKRSTMEYLHAYELPASHTLLRLLILKRIYDRYGSN
ncbi:asparagine synthase-related protein [Haliangium ochraceum]|uniref:asparagine synthase (glutamine-hydrolyzing) n=1 Tax=Haliangium ochraceum (strain DSM 14365 / JCM 11303 / SMP-2) TaxID=502025 RepID=D0LZ75_HALO1|nr:asparagine synthase-related protein [Haliangium ochraceum]ACY16337.1 asparagine synthase [Haliangium ochraceum DSM 14365]